MSHIDASFTFLHRIEEIESNIEDKRWQSALALALTLPDICGGIAFPEIVKKYRDGRIRLDKQNNPTRDVGSQYMQWFNTYAASYFKSSPEDELPYISGERCWQLRCEYLHQNKGFLNEENDEEVRFHLGVNCGTSVCECVDKKRKLENKDIRIDIQEFCLRMCHAARNYYENTHYENDFGLYNTPVLDFIQTTQRGKYDKRVFVVSKNSTYGEALKMTVQSLVKQVYVFSKLEKGKPDLWIVNQDSLQKENLAKLIGKNTPVILIANKNIKTNLQWSEQQDLEKIEILQMPVSVEILKRKVQDLLE